MGRGTNGSSLEPPGGGGCSGNGASILHGERGMTPQALGVGWERGLRAPPRAGCTEEEGGGIGAPKGLRDGEGFVCSPLALLWEGGLSSPSRSLWGGAGGLVQGASSH